MMENGTKTKRITIKRERNEGDPCGTYREYFSGKNKQRWLRYKVCCGRGEGMGAVLMCGSTG